MNPGNEGTQKYPNEQIIGGFTNFTKHTFPPNIAALLSYGPNYMLPIPNLQLYEFLISINELNDQIKEHDMTTYYNNKVQLYHKITRFLAEFDHTLSKKEKYIINTIVDLDLFLSDKNIHIIESDKTKSTVAIEDKEYRELTTKMINEGMLNGLYKPVKAKGEYILNKLLSCYNCKVRVIRSNFIFYNRTPQNIQIEEQCNYILNNYSNKIPQMYPTIKTHKNPHKMRPIVDRKYAINTTIGLVINKILSPIKTNWDLEHNFNINVKNTIVLAHNLKFNKINNIISISTLDINNMYNELNRDDLITQLKTLIDPQLYNTELLFTLINFDLYESSYFKFNNILYKQNKGIPMGSNTSSLYSEIYIDLIIYKHMEELLNIGLIKITKYCDDFLIIAKPGTEDKIKTFLESILKLQFTINLMINNSITYLDLNISYNINTNNIIVDWYKKPITSNRLIHFSSFHDMDIKINTIRARLLKAILITDPEYLKNPMNTIILEIKNNQYPFHIIKNILIGLTNNLDKYINYDNEYRYLLEQDIQLKKVTLKEIITNLKLLIYKNNLFTNTTTTTTSNNIIVNNTDQNGKANMNNHVCDNDNIHTSYSQIRNIYENLITLSGNYLAIMDTQDINIHTLNLTQNITTTHKFEEIQLLQNKTYKSNRHNTVTSNNKYYTSITYMGHKTKRLQRNIKRLIPNLTIAMKNTQTNKLSNVYRNKKMPKKFYIHNEKDKKPYQKSIILISCNNCPLQTITHITHTTIQNKIQTILNSNNPFSDHIRTDLHNINTKILILKVVISKHKADKYITQYIRSHKILNPKHTIIKT